MGGRECGPGPANSHAEGGNLAGGLNDRHRAPRSSCHGSIVACKTIASRDVVCAESGRITNLPQYRPGWLWPTLVQRITSVMHNRRSSGHSRVRRTIASQPGASATRFLWAAGPVRGATNRLELLASLDLTQGVGTTLDSPNAVRIFASGAPHADQAPVTAAGTSGVATSASIRPATA